MSQLWRPRPASAKLEKDPWTGIIKTIMDRLDDMGEARPERYGLPAREFRPLKAAVRDYQLKKKRKPPAKLGPFKFRDTWIYEI